VIAGSRRRSPILPVAVAALAFVGLLGGCAGGATRAPAGSPVATTTVDLPPSYKFVPTAIVVGTGATVTWTNNDHFTHSVQFLDGGLPTTPLLMDPGASATFVFDRPGVYRYQCHLHPQNMQGTVTVGS
jgi:plastocyanin